jgi:hypothetical protein
MTHVAGRRIMEYPSNYISVRKSGHKDLCRRLGLYHHRQIRLLRCWPREVDTLPEFAGDGADAVVIDGCGAGAAS